MASGKIKKIDTLDDISRKITLEDEGGFNLRIDLDGIEAADEDADDRIQQLLSLGRDQGAVTYDDVMRFFPEAEGDIEGLEEAFSVLAASHIEVVDSLLEEDENEEDESENETEGEVGH